MKHTTLSKLAALFLSLLLPASATFAQKTQLPPLPSKPKLVVGIIVDQMRADYLPRYWNKYGSDGFKKLINEGFNCISMNYNYVPTYTGPGHASVYTGATPSVHGIVGNYWFSREENRMVYCTEDKTVQNVGGDGKQGQMSPKLLRAQTLCDAVKLANEGKGKVIGISQKDRAAILPAGQSADAAYWLDDRSGHFITS